jgi:hypothetical protein
MNHQIIVNPSQHQTMKQIRKQLQIIKFKQGQHHLHIYHLLHISDADFPFAGTSKVTQSSQS